MREQLMQLLIEYIGLSEESAETLIQSYGELNAQKHTMYCLYAMTKGRVKNPPAWFTASLKNDWSAPVGMPLDWVPRVMHFRVDENTFAQIERDIQQNKREGY